MLERTRVNTNKKIVKKRVKKNIYEKKNEGKKFIT